MNLKQKLLTGILFLFGLLLLTGGAGITALVQMKQRSQAVLQDNYESLEYCHAMLASLDSLYLNKANHATSFENQLIKQENNITEVGEAERTAALRHAFEQFRHSSWLDSEALHQIRGQINHIIAINMAAMEAKNTRSLEAAGKAFDFIALLSTLIFLMAFTFVFNFPGFIIRPVEHLREGIREIMQKNYRHRVPVESHDELGELAEAFNLMAARLDEYEHSSLAQLMFEKTRAEAVVNSLQEAGFGVDTDGRVLFANQIALDLLTLKSSEVVGKPLAALCSRNDLLRHIVESTFGAPFKIVVDGKEQFFVREQNAILKDGQALGILYSLHNITAYQERDTAKTNFIATISHELKTPLAATDIGLKLLEKNPDENLTSDQIDIVHDLQRDNSRLIKLVSELLDLSQAEAGRLNLKMAPVPVTEISDLALAAVQSAAREKRIGIKTDLEPGLPALEADREKSVWVLINLLTNAIRHTPEGGVVVLSARLESDHSVRISVRDQGPGIAKVYHEKIFQPFFKIASTPGQNKSSGLGLSISKEFMTAMNGGIGVISESGKGAEFWVTFQAVS